MRFDTARHSRSRQLSTVYHTGEWRQLHSNTLHIVRHATSARVHNNTGVDLSIFGTVGNIMVPLEHLAKWTHVLR